MLIYSFMVYSWPVNLLKDLDRWVRNFIWSGDLETKRLITVAWHKVCCPLYEGGLGIRPFRKINEAAMLRLCWLFMTSNSHWSKLLRSRVVRGQGLISYHIGSSIWLGIKSYFLVVKQNLAWQIGNGANINFWTDQWLNAPLVDILNIPPHLHDQLITKIKDLIGNGSWCVPPFLFHCFPVLENAVRQVILPAEACNDQAVWKLNSSGQLTFKDAFLFLNPPKQVIS